MSVLFYIILAFNNASISFLFVGFVAFFKSWVILAGICEVINISGRKKPFKHTKGIS